MTSRSCGSLQVSSPPKIVRGVPAEAARDSAHIAALAAANREAQQYYRQVEWRLQVHPDRPPQLAVALSGGGLRSAIFSLGALSGLHELKVFPQRTDLLSAVSGGAYVASWFYAQQILHGYSPDDLLQPGIGGQRYLEDHAKFVKISLEYPGSLASIITTLVPMGVVNLFANGVFGWHANTPVSSRYYKYRYQRTFFSGGCGAEDAAACAPTVKAPSVSWQQVNERISGADKSHDPAHHLPNLILNTTADIGYFYGEKARRGFNSVYEFTPQRFGSEGMGYFCYPFAAGSGSSQESSCEKPWPEIGPLERITMTSGAAYDTSRLHYRPLRLLFSVLNFDLGHFFPNPNATLGQDWQLALPFPLYLFPFTRHRLDSQGRRMLLSDGGHSDNLGVYSLVRRTPAKIVVVDGESDAKHNFGAYHKLKQKLLDDLNLVLSIPAIDAGEPGPVYYGTIGKLPPTDDATPTSIQVIYLKIPTRSFVRERCAERERLGEMGKVPDGAIPETVCSFLRRNSKFPFNGTFTDLYYTPDQFRAYRDLGSWIVTSADPQLAEKLAVGD